MWVDVFGDEDLFPHREKVAPPLPYGNLPQGRYVLRGKSKAHRKAYYYTGSVWYLTEDVTQDNGHYLCDAAIYELFPPLSEKEWDALRSVPYKCLSKTWRRYLSGHDLYMEFRNTSREAKRASIEFFRGL